ncbi:MAG: hypothetical protein L0312_13940 [Acidobacteria bacterium]|nr:hypothetical protein [Acidobacteriota bacterium]
MQRQLRDQNEDLLREIEGIAQSVGAALIPPELEPYRKWLQDSASDLRGQVERNLLNLARPQVDILTEVLDQTSVVIRGVYVLNDRYLGPLLRARDGDRLSLRLLDWMHKAHSRTAGLPVALADGSFGSWPVESWPTVYLVPPGGQQRLLHLPLCFHEFGHLLYACHQDEMDDLVRDLQQSIARMLEPAARRNDAQARREQQRRKQIVERWYDWAQEFFCDAVGLLMGGPAFALSFSFYFRTIGQDAYQRSFADQIRSNHPVTWLRIRLLADRARKIGFNNVADQIEDDWENVASMLRILEDYFGCYDQAFLPDLNKTLDDMLTEAAPRPAANDEVNHKGPITKTLTPPAVFNLAWRMLEADSPEYVRWEAQAVSDWMG